MRIKRRKKRIVKRERESSREGRKRESERVAEKGGIERERESQTSGL